MWTFVENFSTKFFNNVNLQIVRWKRKPRWVPVAKSKVFRIPERKSLPVDEQQEFLRLMNNYRTEVKSIRSYFVEMNPKKETSTSVHFFQNPINEEAEFRKRISENNEWNNKIASERAQRLQKQAQELKTIALKRISEQESRKEEQRRIIENIVQEEKEQIGKFINKENLKGAIEYALANPADYNFAIDLDGQLHNDKDNAVKVD